MADIFDYIYWRGDLKITYENFTDVDGMVLSRLSYLPFDGFVPKQLDEKVTLRQAAEKVLASEENLSNILWKKDTELLKKAAESERFGNIFVSGYINIVEDNPQVQFAAIIFELDDSHRFISYRGTDNTIVGWQEDFNLFFMFPLPSQELALSYFEEAVKKLGGSFILGGHSKGGNLAIYSASFCMREYQKHISKIYNLDGPGFDREAISESGFIYIRDKIFTYVPQSSIFGMMFEHDESYTVIKSNRKGFLQHDIYSWEIEPTTFVTLNDVTNTSVFFDHTLSDFVEKMNNEERKTFSEAIFNILKTTEDRTFNEILANWFKDTGQILKSLKNLDSETRSLIASTILSFIKCAGNNFSDVNPIRNEILKLRAKETRS